MLFWRLTGVATYYHHDLAVLIPAVKCWCFPASTPYGYLWYLIDYPLSFNYPLYLAIADFFISLAILRYALFWLYLPISWIIYYAAPYDLPIIWLSLLGIISPYLLAIAPLAKLPDNPAMWNTIFHHPLGLNDYEYYLITAVPWLWILTVHIRKKWTLHKSFKHPSNISHPQCIP